MLTKSELDEIRARCEAATPGPWHGNVFGYGGVHILWGSVYMGDGELVRIGHNESSNADFVARARQDVPDLLEEVERLRAALRQVESHVWKWPERGNIVGGYNPARGRFQICDCRLCGRQFTLYSSGEKEGKHADNCAFAMLKKGGDTLDANNN